MQAGPKIVPDQHRKEIKRMENGKLIYMATGSHRSPQYANMLINAKFEVRSESQPDRDTVYYAVCPEYGCGKNYATPEDAVRNMLFEHGYTNIKVNKLLQEHDIGEQVLCDYCNVSYTSESPEQGGLLIGSYAVCPKCQPHAVENLNELNEVHLIRGQCPPDMTFHAWVMQLRGGNNTIRVLTMGEV